VEGIVSPSALQGPDAIDFMTLSGNLQQVTYPEMKALCFITESAKTDLFQEHNLFERRPKAPGLWTRFTLRDGDQLDGILPHNLLEWPPTGYLITPPRAGVSRQRVFLPRAAVTATELRGVVGVSTRAAAAKSGVDAIKTGGQLSMFDS
jgi:hypothetical protein